MNERNEPAEARREPAHDHDGRAAWHRPSYHVIEASMEVSAYFLADR
ncbi:hypothetical protein ACFYY8_30005 [Streptosporangium sp. NPDC001559]